MKTLVTLLVITSLYFGNTASYGQIQVPEDYGSIQEAINNADPNEVITVHNGIYTENLIIDKPLTIRSDFFLTNNTLDIENTIIDANLNGSAIQMSDIEGVVHLIGFTLINGTGTLYEVHPGVFIENGGGLFVNNVASLYLDNMIIKDHHLVSTNNAGGGMYAEASQVNVYNTEVLNNSTEAESVLGEGAGFKFVDCIANVQFSVFEGNHSNGYDNGGAVYATGGTLSIGNSNFNQNFGTSGGGVCVIDADAFINDCNFTNNESDHSGSAIRANEFSDQEHTITVNNCNFNGNKTLVNRTGGTLSFTNTNANVSYCDLVDNENAGGGALVNLNANVVMDYCIISNNITKYVAPSGYEHPHRGAGVLVSNGILLLKNSEVTNNECAGSSPDDGGGGFNITYQSDVTIEDCRIAGNSADEGGAIYARESEVKLVRTLIDQNFGVLGGAIHGNNTNYTFIHSDVVRNITIGDQGAAIYTSNSDNYTFVNSILSNPGWNEVHKKQGTLTSNFTFSHSNIRGHESAFINNDLINKTWMSGNLDLDSQFTDVDNAVYTLLHTSPLIDAGTDYLEIAGTVIVAINVSDYYGSAPDIGVYENENFVGIPTVVADDFIVFPNPTTRSITFVTEKRIDRVQLYDTNAKLVIEAVPINKTISVSQLQDGYYWIKVWSKDAVIYNKLILKKSL